MPRFLTAQMSLCPNHIRIKTPVLGNVIPILGEKLKWGYYVFWLFFKIDMCSATPFKRSRRELSIDVAEHRSILKNNQNTYLRFGFTPKTDKAFPKTRALFLLYDLQATLGLGYLKSGALLRSTRRRKVEHERWRIEPF